MIRATLWFRPVLIFTTFLLLAVVSACADKHDQVADDREPADPVRPEAAEPTSSPTETAVAAGRQAGAETDAAATSLPSRPPLQLPVVTPASPAEIAAFDPFSFDLQNLAALSPPHSFFLDYRFVVTATEAYVVHLDVLYAFSREPDAAEAHIKFSVSGDFDDTLQLINVTQLGPDSYSYQEERGCLLLPGTNELSGMESFFDDFPNQYLVGGVLPQLVAEDISLNGTVTDHYRVERQDVAEGSLHIAELVIDLYMDRVTGHAVRLVMYARDTSGADAAGGFLETPFGFSDGDIRVEIDVLGLNQPQHIAIPEICAAAGETLYPVPEVATGVTGNFEFTTFLTTLEPAEIVAFYREALARQGWTELLDDTPLDLAAENITLRFRGTSGRLLIIAIRSGEGEAARTVVITDD